MIDLLRGQDGALNLEGEPDGGLEEAAADGAGMEFWIDRGGEGTGEGFDDISEVGAEGAGFGERDVVGAGGAFGGAGEGGGGWDELFMVE